MSELSSLKHWLLKLMPQLELRENEPLNRHTSFKIGGPASLMAFPSNVQELIDTYGFSLYMFYKPVILGNGTNVLAADEGVDNIVISTRGVNGITHLGGGLFRAECGATLASLAQAAAKEGYTGLEFAHGIPGSVGGGVLMNAGAYGGEVKDTCVSIRWMREVHTVVDIPAANAGFGYRESRFSREKGMILSADFQLKPGNSDEIKAKMNELAAKRRASQPLDMPSAGSTFKRPADGYAAALIEQAGLKGFSVGGAQVSEKHAGFVVNTGGATSADVLELIDHIQNRVFQSSGIRIEPEVKLLEN